jgi:hypothetical protein
MSEWLALGLVPLLGVIFLSFSAWAEGSMLSEKETPLEIQD